MFGLPAFEVREHVTDEIVNFTIRSDHQRNYVAVFLIGSRGRVAQVTNAPAVRQRRARRLPFRGPWSLLGGIIY